MTHSEVQTYANLAKQYCYVVILVEPKTPWKFEPRKLAAKNAHNVSYPKICKKVEQFDEILPHYFGWFLSPAECVRLQIMAKDVLWKCLQVPEFCQSIKAFAGNPKYLFSCCLTKHPLPLNLFAHVHSCMEKKYSHAMQRVELEINSPINIWKFFHN